MKKKEEIFSIIKNARTKEEIEEFVKKQVKTLESNSHKTIIDEDNTTRYSDYISNKVTYKIAKDVDLMSLPGIVYDDLDAYVNFILQIKDKIDESYDLFSLFNDVSKYCETYLRHCNIDEEGIMMLRDNLYFGSMLHGVKEISIKEIASKGVGYCVEIAGLSQNLLKIMGINSEVVLGTNEGERHVYNLVYPNSYGKSPAVFFDPCGNLAFIKKDKSTYYEYAYFKTLSDDEYHSLLNGEEVLIDPSLSAAYYYKKDKDKIGDIYDYYIYYPKLTYSLIKSPNILKRKK